MIPKVIHYCWFGTKKKPKEVLQCISSWKEFLPEYEIIEWNETNSDLSHSFVKHFYDIKKWAFVSDYVRLQVLYNHGGIYLDTDMLVVKSINDLLHDELFLGAENEKYIAAGIIGSQKGNEFIRQCIKEYDLINFNNEVMAIAIPKIITNLFKSKYDVISFESLLAINNCTIYPKNYFYPFPFSKKREPDLIPSFITTETYAIHLWIGSWLDNQEFYYIRNRDYSTGLKKIFSDKNKKIDLKYLRKILSSFKESLNKK